MCGISGIVYADPARVPSPAEVAAMCDAIAHRGPDDSGVFAAPGAALGSRRLAIVDLSERGHMPMRTEDGRYHIVYNGEVYNAAELRAWLEARGRRFRSTTDTEVLVNLYAEQGAAMLERLNGMFALAIWDARERTLFLARDRLGVKPLYYAADADGLRFASEQKALFAAGVPAAFDHATWAELLCFRYVAGERTPFTGVRRLLPGHHLTWREGRATVQRWWHLGGRAEALRGAAAHAPGRAAEWFRETFDDAVELRRISDVPVGVLLSGGLDSSSVAAALARRAGGGVESFTVVFDDPRFDEGPLAGEVARRWGLRAHTLRVPESGLLELLLRASWLNDEPLAHGNEIHLEAIARHAKPTVTVLLSGEGADETLGGYVRYRPLRHPGLLAVARAAARVVPAGVPLGGRLRKLARALRLSPHDALVLYNACDVLPGDLRELGLADSARAPYRDDVLAEARRHWPRDLVRQAMYLDQHTFLCSLLDRNDRMTMGASIECRVPFLDYRLVEGLAACPTGTLFRGSASKPVLRTAVGDRLPPSLLRAPKWGFGVPWTRYLRTVPALRDLVRGLPDARPVREGPLDRRAVGRTVRAFLGGDDRPALLVRQLTFVAAWHQAAVESVAHTAVAQTPAGLAAPRPTAEVA